MSSWMNGIGSLHLVAVHVPIGAIMLTFLLDAYVRRRPATTARDCVRLALWVCLATAAVTALLGVLRVMSGSYDMTWVIRHGLGALVTIVFLGGTLVLGRGLVTQRWSSSRARLYAVSFVAVLGAVAFTGHVGGVLAHGLPFVPWLAESRPAVDGSGGHAALRVLEQRSQAVTVANSLRAAFGWTTAPLCWRGATVVSPPLHRASRRPAR